MEKQVETFHMFWIPWTRTNPSKCAWTVGERATRVHLPKRPECGSAREQAHSTSQKPVLLLSSLLRAQWLHIEISLSGCFRMISIFLAYLSPRCLLVCDISFLRALQLVILSVIKSICFVVSATGAPSPDSAMCYLTSSLESTGLAAQVSWFTSWFKDHGSEPQEGATLNIQQCLSLQIVLQQQLSPGERGAVMRRWSLKKPYKDPWATWNKSPGSPGVPSWVCR